MNFFRSKKDFNLLGRFRIFFYLSTVVILIGLAALAWRGSDIFSLDFTGGYLTQLEFSRTPDVEKLRSILLAEGFTDHSIQVSGDDGERVIIRTRQPGQVIIPLIRENFPGALAEVLSEEEISPIMGRTIRRQTVIGFFVALAAILIYISIRFEFRFAVAAIVALVHDLLVALTLLALTGRRLDSIVIAAFLTIAGYSVNDTVVIFDRIRENIRGLRKVGENIEPVFNHSINENISRTVITSFSTLLAAGSLYFLGGPVLNDFAFILIIGVISGTYSSIFIATATVLAWEKKHPHRFKTS